jgi:type II secretory pathway pseudopilin PulG
MKIMRLASANRKRSGVREAFTLIEVVIAGAIAALVMAGMFEGYTMAGRRAQFSACSVAATSEAMHQLEGAFSAEWVPAYGENALLALGGTNTANLCLPIAESNLITCTNYTTVTEISTNPPYAMIQVQCVWGFPNYGGTYTNTVSVLRAPNE